MFSQKGARALNLDGSRMFNCNDFPWKKTLKILALHRLKCSSEILQLTEKASEWLFIPQPVLITRGYIKVLLMVV